MPNGSRPKQRQIGLFSLPSVSFKFGSCCVLDLRCPRNSLLPRLISRVDTGLLNPSGFEIRVQLNLAISGSGPGPDLKLEGPCGRRPSGSAALRAFFSTKGFPTAKNSSERHAISSESSQLFSITKRSCCAFGFLGFKARRRSPNGLLRDHLKTELLSMCNAVTDSHLPPLSKHGPAPQEASPVQMPN